MFVKKLVERASKKNIECGAIRSLRAEDVSPRLAFHYGVPAEASFLAYDPTHQILAVATRNGQIKLFGRDNTQALLRSDAAVPTMFLQFMNQGILLNVTAQNHIEVWDIDAKTLCDVHIFNQEITSFTVLQPSYFVYVGDCLGAVIVLKLDYGKKQLIEMQYRIPFSESYGSTAEAGKESSVLYILQQPQAQTESKRVVIVFKDGLISLWDIQASNVLFVSGRSTQHSSYNEPKTVTAACWGCSNGSKIVVGYSNGEILVWAIPLILNQKNEPVMNQKDLNPAQSFPLLKLNLGYKMDKVPIASLRWVASDGRTSRLYINGFSDSGVHSFQVLILNDSTESRTIKLTLPLTEACLAMELITCLGDQNKNKQNTLLLLLKSGHLCLYDDSEIERYLIQCQSKSPPTLPKQIMVRLPFGDYGITATKLYTRNSPSSSLKDEDSIILSNKYPCFLSINKEKDKNHSTSTCITEFCKAYSLLITGHQDGTINFWDASCPLLLLISSIRLQNEDSNSNVAPVSLLHFDTSSKLLISGDHSGLVRIITFRRETSENVFSFLQAKPGDNYTVHSFKLKGAITSASLNLDSKHLAIGTDKGYVSLINLEDNSVLYQKQFHSRLYSGITSLQFESYGHNGLEKQVVLVGIEDSSIMVLEEDTGNVLTTDTVHTKKPSRAILMQIVDAQTKEASVSDNQDRSNDNPCQESLAKHSLLLLCSENAVRLFSLVHAIQGIKKLVDKKKLSGTCCYASVIYGPSSNVGLLLVFASGRIEIRSLPDLSLLKDVSLRGFTWSKDSSSYGAWCSSLDGELVMINGHQEALFFSVLCRNDIYRYLEHINLVYRRDFALLAESSYATSIPKEKKKGIFGMVVKELKGNKIKHGEQAGADDSSACNCEELAEIFSKANFPLYSERRNSLTEDKDDALHIDDIVIDDIDDNKWNAKGRNLADISKRKIEKGLQSLKGKLKSKTDEKANLEKVKVEDEVRITTVDQIKMKYGHPTNNESSILKIAENKLKENARKLEAINVRSAEMASSAQTFSSMAKELLQNAKNERN